MNGRADRQSWEEAVRTEVRARGWKALKSGEIRRVTDHYRFALHVPAPRVGLESRGRITAKPLALDPVFWKIIGDSELNRKRIALMEFDVGEVAYSSEDDAHAVAARLAEMFEQIEPDLRTLDDFAPTIAAHTPPRTGQVLATCVSWLIAVDRPNDALQLVRDAIADGVDGGYRFPAGSFEDLAVDHLGAEHERGMHVESIDGGFRRIFPGVGWTVESRLRMDIGRMDGDTHFALALWRLPEDADRQTRDGRWDAASYIQCAGGPDRFVIEVRTHDGDGFEQVALGHGATGGDSADGGETVDVQRGAYTSTVRAAEVFDPADVLAILLEYVDHDRVSDVYTRRALDLPE